LEKTKGGNLFEMNYLSVGVLFVQFIRGAFEATLKLFALLVLGGNS